MEFTAKDQALLNELYAKNPKTKEDNKQIKALKRKRSLAKQEANKKKGAGKPRQEGGSIPKVGANDPSWYKKYPELMDNAANFPFNHIAGEQVNFGDLTITTSYNLPVGVVLNYIRTPGKCEKASDAYNWQVRDLWLKMHRKYRGMGGYDWSDLGAVLFAIMNVFADFARAERVYALASKFMVLNRSYPDVLLSALRINVAGITGDALADYRYQINRLIRKASLLCLPKGIPAIDVFLTIDSQVFKDSDSARALWYVYDTPYRIEFDATTTGTGSACMYKTRTYTGGSQGYGNTQLLSDIIGDLETQLDILLGDTDVAKMCSDIIACFGEGGFMSLMPLSEDYTITPVRDDNRLLQLHNTSLNGNVYSYGVPTAVTWPASSGIMLYQNMVGGILEFKLSSLGTTTGSKVTDSSGNQHYVTTNSLSSIAKTVGNTPLDIWKDAVTTDDVIEMTRQSTNCATASFTVSGTTYYHKPIQAFGLIVVMNMEVWNNARNSSTPYGQVYYTFGSDSINSNNNYAFRCLEPCDWHPPIYDNASGSFVKGWFFDTDNPKGMDGYTLDRLHQAAVMSAYTIPAFNGGSNN